jgi:predicted metalloprotease
MGGMPISAAGLAGLGVPGLIILLVVVALNVMGGGGGPQEGARPGGQTGSSEDERLVQFISFVLDDVQGVWRRQFNAAGDNYRPAQLVLFTQSTSTGCGFATSEVGPFYCPADETVYLDLDFFRELKRRFGAPGDFAQAYVIAHEIGHHVQHLLGVSDAVHEESQKNPDRANPLSIRLELQADCLAGVWGHTTERRELLEPGDLEEGLDAAAAIGDDRIQKQATGTTNPETWTHGSSRQRMEWFSTGFDSGDPDACNTFRGDI